MLYERNVPGQCAAQGCAAPCVRTGEDRSFIAALINRVRKVGVRNDEAPTVRTKTVILCFLLLVFMKGLSRALSLFLYSRASIVRHPVYPVVR